MKTGSNKRTRWMPACSSEQRYEGQESSLNRAGKGPLKEWCCHYKYSMEKNVGLSIQKQISAHNKEEIGLRTLKSIAGAPLEGDIPNLQINTNIIFSRSYSYIWQQKVLSLYFFWLGSSSYFLRFNCTGNTLVYVLDLVMSRLGLDFVPVKCSCSFQGLVIFIKIKKFNWD